MLFNKKVTKKEKVEQATTMEEMMKKLQEVNGKLDNLQKKAFDMNNMVLTQK